jgi:hypothetical protein
LNKTILLLAVISFLFVSGCADVEIPKTKELLSRPTGPGGSVKIGMTKDKVVDVYGEPNLKNTVVADKWGGSREEWIYKAEFSAFPVSAGYLGEDMYIYFDGNNVTDISSRPLGKESEDVKKTSR